MKTIEETLQHIREEFALNRQQREMFDELHMKEAEIGHEKVARDYARIREEYQIRMNVLTNMYAFIIDKSWLDCYHELSTYAKEHRNAK